MPDRSLTIAVPGRDTVSAILRVPHQPRGLLVLAHGAGAGMRHPFLASLAAGLEDHRIATLRYQFPAMEAGGRRPDRPPVAVATVRAALAAANEIRAADPALAAVPLHAGGKSFGGRMTSTAGAGAPLDGVAGLVFVGFPLHPAGKPGTVRADHLAAVPHPLLFLQGTRDGLARFDLIGEVCARLGPRARLVRIEGADHGFGVLARSGRTAGEVIGQLAEEIAATITGESNR